MQTTSFVIIILLQLLPPTLPFTTTTTTLFKPSSRYPCFRQPVLVTLSNNIVLAFAENRNVTSCAPAYQPNSNEIGSLQLRRSTDNGNTFSTYQELFVGDIDFYSVLQDVNTSTTWLFLENIHQVQILQSNDYGGTWSLRQPLDIHQINGLPYNFSTIIKPTVGHAIQTNSQRLIVPFICTNMSVTSGGSSDKGSCPSCQSCLLLSDDHGKNWYFGAIGQSGSRETSIVQTSTTSIYASERNFGPNPGKRMFGSSIDGGVSYNETGLAPELITPDTKHWTGIVAAVTTLNATDIVYVGVSTPNVRSDLKMYFSNDSGKRWKSGINVWQGPAGYADAIHLNNNVIGVLFESGTVTFADEITFARVDLN